MAKSAVNVRTGPGTSYGIVDQLTAGEVVNVTECAPSNFCFVERDGADGWVSANYLTSVDEDEDEVDEGGGANPDCSFGFVITPSGPQMSVNCGDAPMPPMPPAPPAPPEPEEDDEPTACFYTGNSFTGDELCLGVGIRNSLNATFNNKISSVELSNGARARLCDGPNLTGTCRNVNVDTTPLTPDINNKASSLTVYVGAPPLPPLPPPPAPAPVTHSTGPIDLPQSFLANLDNGNVGGGAGADIWYEAVSPAEKYITPRNGALLALGDGSNRGYDGCADESFSNDSIAIEDAPPGTYVCAKTNQGRISQLRVNGFSGITMHLGYTTWAD